MKVEQAKAVNREFQQKQAIRPRKVKASIVSDDLSLPERTERAQHLFRLRSNLANGSADALNSARSCLTFDSGRRYAHYVDRFAASIEPGAKSGNTSQGGRQERQVVLQDIDDELEKLAIAHEEAFPDGAYN